VSEQEKDLHPRSSKSLQRHFKLLIRQM